MQLYGIKKLLNIPEYKVKEIILITAKEIYICLEAYKKKNLSAQSYREETQKRVS